MPYTAYVLDSKSRSKLLAKFPPKFPDVVCHHVTERFGVSKLTDYTPPPAKVVVVGYVCDESLEALVVTVDGDTKRSDGKVFHITHSLDKSQGRKPVDSNDVIAKLGWTPVDPIEIETTPKQLN